MIIWLRQLWCAMRGHPGILPWVRDASGRYHIIAVCHDCGKCVDLSRSGGAKP